jgi:hypothetical protein
MHPLNVHSLRAGMDSRENNLYEHENSGLPWSGVLLFLNVNGICTATHTPHSERQVQFEYAIQNDVGWQDLNLRPLRPEAIPADMP